ncbi:MAG: hypothetical protein K2X87_12775 [Gemmataceae bacterium]|nr:hypothetical protein [Gemmataceae bacterium]
MSRARLDVEELEGRWVPAAKTFLWAPPGNNPAWINELNWKVRNEETGEWNTQSSDYPGMDDNDDRVELRAGPSGVNKDCILDLPRTVRWVKIWQGYTSTLFLLNRLTIAGSDYDSFVEMNSQATIRGSRPAPPSPQGTLVMAGYSSFLWEQGRLYDITVDVQRTDATKFAQFEVAAETGVRTQENATVSVNGLLTWTSGVVEVPPPAAGLPKSQIQVNAGGRFDISTVADRLGATDPARLDVVNNGAVTVGMPTAAAEATLVADYVTSGTTRIDKGVLKVVGKAEPSGGTFVLAGSLPADATARVLGNGAVLGIRGGSIVGIGTVDANLHLANQDGTGTASISPGNIPARPRRACRPRRPRRPTRPGRSSSTSRSTCGRPAPACSSTSRARRTWTRSPSPGTRPSGSRATPAP